MYTLNTKDVITAITYDFKNILLFYKNNVIIKKRGIAYRFDKELIIDAELYDRTFQNKDIVMYEKRDTNDL